MLTRKQHELLAFIDHHLKTTGFSPSFEEMKDGLNLKSKSGIHRLISALEERGFLQRRHHRARALEVIKVPEDIAALHASTVALNAVTAVREAAAREAAARDAAARQEANFAPNVIRGDFSARLHGVRAANEAAAVELPMYGRIAAGMPIEALRDTGAHVEIPVAMIGQGEHYALEVAGDSMVEAGIWDGDTVIIRRGESADNGQIVVALVDDTEVTLKRLRRRGNSIALEPANQTYKTQIFPADKVKVQGRLVALLRQY
jgi:repressor LexA